MQWAITRNTCEEAKIDKNTAYACVSNNSHCITNDAGYACTCSNGYRGNPYIVGGCIGSFDHLHVHYFPLVFLSHANATLKGNFTITMSTL